MRRIETKYFHRSYFFACEGLNVGSIDFGYVGEAPPIFAQAAGASFDVYCFVLTAGHATVPQAQKLLSTEICIEMY